MTALPTVELDPPTISMTFGVNDSPLAGRDGTHVSHDYLLLQSSVIISTQNIYVPTQYISYYSDNSSCWCFI